VGILGQRRLIQWWRHRSVVEAGRPVRLGLNSAAAFKLGTLGRTSLHWARHSVRLVHRGRKQAAIGHTFAAAGRSKLA